MSEEIWKIRLSKLDTKIQNKRPKVELLSNLILFSLLVIYQNYFETLMPFSATLKNNFYTIVNVAI